MHSVYVVIASHGSYSDYTERILCWFANKAEAEEFAKLCRKELDDVLAKCQEDPDWEYWGLGLGYKDTGKWWEMWRNQYDPGWSGEGYDTNNTKYTVSEIPKAVWSAVKQEDVK